MPQTGDVQAHNQRGASDASWAIGGPAAAIRWRSPSAHPRPTADPSRSVRTTHIS